MEAAQLSTLGKAVSKANEKLANRIGNLLVHAYGDAKKLTLTGFSFPARVIISKQASNFLFNVEAYTNEDHQTHDFQYLTPAAHKEFLQCIVESHRHVFTKTLADVLALSLRCNGSVDCTQVDKIFVMANIVTKDRIVENCFLGAREPPCRGAKGLLNAIQEACESTVGITTTKFLVKQASSLVTDGASVNVGSKNGLWTLLDKLHSDSSASEIPFLKIWCSVHRSSLA